MPGFPDFQVYSVRQTPSFLPEPSPALLPGVTNYGPFAVSSYDGVSLRVTPTAGYGAVTVSWWDDAAETMLVGQDTWAVSQFWGLSALLVVQAPFVSVSVNVTSGVNMTGLVRLSGKATGVPQNYYPVTQNHIRLNAVSVPASATRQFVLPWVNRGLGWLSFNPADAAAKLYVQTQVINADLTLNYVVAKMGTPAALVNQQVTFVDDAFALQVVNLDGAAAHSFDAYLALG